MTMNTVFMSHMLDLLRGAMIAIAAFWAVLFFLRNDRTETSYPSQLRWLMGALMSWLALTFTLNTTVWWPMPLNHPLQDALQMLDLMVLPLAALVLTRVTHRREVNTALALSHVLPFVMAVGFCWGCPDPVVYRIVMLLCVVYSIVIVIISIIAAVRYHRYVLEQYSDLYGRTVSWLWSLPLYLGCEMAAWILYGETDMVEYQVLAYALHLLLWSMVSVYVMRAIRAEEHILTALTEHRVACLEQGENRVEDVESAPVEDSPADAHRQRVEWFRERLVEVCEKPKLYTREDLTRDDLSAALHLNHTYVSQLLREATGKTFYEYINALRLDYAEQLLLSRRIPIDQISWQAGFRNRGTFYRAFHQRHGCTPKEFRRRN